MEKSKQFRTSDGRFGRKRIAVWRANISAANKKRCVKRNVAENARRIVDIGILAHELWCSACQLPLSFRHIVKEKIRGLGSTFHIKCSQCLEVKIVQSSAYDVQVNCPKFHVNLMVALAILDGGIGEMHLNTILSALNIPPIHHNFLKRYERIVGPVVESVAKDSCLAALRLEKALTIAHEKRSLELADHCDPSSFSIPYLISLDVLEKESPAPQIVQELPFNFDPSTSVSTTNPRDSTVSDTNELLSQEPTGLTASYDAGWQKKGSGRSYNSSTGQGTAFGRFCRKCIGYATRNKSCRFCANGVPKSKHDCRLNFFGSSKAMEPDMAVEIFMRNEHFINENVVLKTLIGDEDSSTIASLRRESDRMIEKWTDKNHAAKKLVKYLYSVSKLSTPVVEYFRKCFGCVLEMNKNCVEGTRKGLLNIVPHSFGQHEMCGSWCSYDSVDYKHKYLPGGKPLVGEELRLSLSQIFQQFADNAEKLAPCGSSQINESANMSVSHKAPKAIHYGSSSSNDFRVAAAICQINMGTVYVNTVYARLGISPLNDQSLKYRVERDKKRKLRGDRIKSRHFKKRRRALFKARQAKTVRAENKEGITYQSNCGFDIGVDFLDEPLERPAVDKHTKVVYFDIETTGLRKTDEIVQIAAKMEEKEYSVYIMPSRAFTPSASAITGLQIRDGKMYINSTPVFTVSPKSALTAFIGFLCSVSSSVVLAAHNGKRFDAPKIVQLVQQLGLLNEFTSVVHGFVDTLPLLRLKLKERKDAKKSFAQAALASDYLGPTAIEGAHNAAVDVHVLQQLLSHDDINISTGELIRNAITVQSIMNAEAEALKQKLNVTALEVLKVSKDSNSTVGISANMISKIAKVGIRLENLQQTYLSAGIEGISILLSQNIGEKGARVTTCKRVIKALVGKLQELKNASS